MEPTAVLEQLFDRKKMAIIKLFIAQPERKFAMLEVARGARVSNATTFRILSRLVSMGLLEEQKIKHLKVYRLAQNEATKYLSRILETGQSAIEAFVDAVLQLPAVEQILMLGKQKRDKASLLVIGSGVDQLKVQAVANGVLERFKFKIVVMVLDPAQYVQMSEMGLYPGEKQVLYRRE